MAPLFDQPERFVIDAVGEPGKRTFFVQVRQGGRLVSIIIEKNQAQTLCTLLRRLFSGLKELGHAVPGPCQQPADLGPLDLPLEPRFRAGEIRLSWEREGGRVIVEFDDALSEATLLVRMSLEQAQEFAVRAERVIASGRPACPLCAQPLDSQGHICPRSNGHRPR
ncbi:MAG: DUF3090 family protein [Propionibacteriaceae bacterium]|nr:DUF3090 family protein [Propionibacteriaceae bacterium]